MIELLVSYDGDVNYQTSGGQSPLYIAVTAHQNSCVEWLLTHSANPALSTNEKDNPLLLAVRLQYVDTVRSMIAQVCVPGMSQARQDRFWFPFSFGVSSLHLFFCLIIVAIAYFSTRLPHYFYFPLLNNRLQGQKVPPPPFTQTMAVSKQREVLFPRLWNHWIWRFHFLVLGDCLGFSVIVGLGMVVFQERCACCCCAYFSEYQCIGPPQT